jgi:5-methylcytosine-specific restriction endonuclease McrA
MELAGKADVLHHYDGEFAYSARCAHPLPAVMRVRAFVDVHEFATAVPLRRANILARDGYACCFCGARGTKLSLDHVLPIARGGRSTWSNLVSACLSCNARKGSRTLAQLGWKLKRAPREPTAAELGIVCGVSASDLSDPEPVWAPYLEPYRERAAELSRMRDLAESL